MTADAVYNALVTLARNHVLSYVPRKVSPYLLFTTSRELPKRLEFPRAIYEGQRRRMELRIEAMRDFMFSDSECRVNRMLRYFGEMPQQPCGQCDVCRSKRKSSESEASLQKSILYLASHPGGCEVSDICGQLRLGPDRVIPLVREMADKGLLEISGTRIEKPKC